MFCDRKYWKSSYDWVIIILVMTCRLFKSKPFGCQLDEPYGFPGDHQQNATMFQCYVHFLYLQSVFCFCNIVVFCGKKLTTTTTILASVDLLIIGHWCTHSMDIYTKSHPHPHKKVDWYKCHLRSREDLWKNVLLQPIVIFKLRLQNSIWIMSWPIG